MTTRKPPSRWKRRLVAAAGLWLALELLLPFAAPRASLALRMHLPPPLYILGETSKAGLLPRDWVLVLGDSYAAGGGDWLLEELGNGGNPPFQATDVLHRLTGRDVLSFGTAGADSSTSTAFQASKRFAQLRRAGLGEPRDVVVYFYEGNDLNDNLHRARKSFGLREREPASYTRAELDELVRGRARSGFLKGLPGALYVPYLAETLVGGEWGAVRAEDRAFEVVPAGAPEAGAEATRIAAGGRSFALVKPAQGPALELDAAELDFALLLLERSLAWTAERFAGTGLRLVYIPSPLACYPIETPEVHAQSYEGRGEERPAELVRARSDELRARVEAIARAAGFAFVDATPALRAAAEVGLVHGPRDVNHLNRAGYEALGAVLAESLAP